MVFIYEFSKNPSGKIVNGSNILYASLVVHGKNKEMYKYDFADGRKDYYEKDGTSIRKALLKTPINGARISSRYGKRRHPVLGFTRMHRGLDYAAPPGTPVYAAGDGTVVIARRVKGGYGRYVKIRHNSEYSTLYGHLKGFKRGIKSGIRVAQGDVIGYVGSSGLATGPHLHYEVIKHGKKVNPAKVNFPKIPNLSESNMLRFKKQYAKIDKMLSKKGYTSAQK